jgi:hypothetical protein
VGIALGHHRQGRIRPLSLGDDPDQRTEIFGDRIADHEDPLIGPDREAIDDHSLDRPVQLFDHGPKAITIAAPAGVAQLVRAAES